MVQLRHRLPQTNQCLNVVLAEPAGMVDFLLRLAQPTQREICTRQTLGDISAVGHRRPRWESTDVPFSDAGSRSPTARAQFAAAPHTLGQRLLSGRSCQRRARRAIQGRLAATRCPEPTSQMGTSLTWWGGRWGSSFSTIAPSARPPASTGSIRLCSSTTERGWVPYKTNRLRREIASDGVWSERDGLRAERIWP